MAALPCNIVLQGCIQFWDLCVHSHYKLSRYASSACKLSLPWLRDGGWGRSRGARWARAQRRKIPALPSLLAFIQLSSMTLPVNPRIHQQHAHLVRFMCFCEISMIYMIYYSFCLFLNILITNKQLIDKSTKNANLRQPPPTSAKLTCPREHLTTQNKGFCMFLNPKNLKFIREKCPSANLRQPPPTSANLRQPFPMF